MTVARAASPQLAQAALVPLPEQALSLSAGPYHTPLAGVPQRTLFMGRVLEIPAQDRSTVTALTLGGSLYLPGQGENPWLPVFALYLKRFREEFRTRNMVSLFVNDLEYDRRFGRLELVGRLESYTLPGRQTVVVENETVMPTALRFGSVVGAAGPGLRFPVSPFQIDNDLRLQLLGEVGYFYAKRTAGTAASLNPPPDTPLYGAHFRLRYDGMRRNLLELPHQGLAAGADLTYRYRQRLRGSDSFSGPFHREYLQTSGYLMAATGVPGLSERNRVVTSLYGGSTGRGDRFNAFVINGGPFPIETDDLCRSQFSTLVYDDVQVTNYLMGSLLYRRELAFFLFLSLEGRYLIADRETVAGGRVVFRNQRGYVGSAAIDTAFFWDSSLFLSYSWDSGFIRGGVAGSGVTLLWNRSF